MGLRVPHQPRPARGGGRVPPPGRRLGDRDLGAAGGGSTETRWRSCSWRPRWRPGRRRAASGTSPARSPRALAARGHAVSVVTPRYGSIDPRRTGSSRCTARSTCAARRRRSGRAGGAPRSTSSSTSATSGRAAGSTPTGTTTPTTPSASRTSAARRSRSPRRWARPRVVHVNDWQTGLVPFLLRHEHAREPALAGARTVFTIHNLAYQGVFRSTSSPRWGCRGTCSATRRWSSTTS